VDEGRKVHAFLGVPFAKCGSGENRFKVWFLGGVLGIKSWFGIWGSDWFGFWKE
jgi:hypothetical protein